MLKRETKITISNYLEISRFPYLLDLLSFGLCKDSLLFVSVRYMDELFVFWLTRAFTNFDQDNCNSISLIHGFVFSFKSNS